MAERVTWTNEKRRLGDLLPWPRNPRTIKNAQAERLVDSVETFGQVETLAIGPGNEIYNGHQRLSVLRGEYGADYEVDVRVASRVLTEKEREKLTIYLHKGAAGEWDFDALANEFEMDDLLAWGFEPFELGLSELEDDGPVGEDPGADVSKADELQAVWNVQLGDLWQLGDHRLICGDCTDEATVQRVMGGEKAALVHADPPYGMGKEADGIANDNLYREKLDDFQMQWWRAARPHIESNGSAYLWGNAEDLWRLWYCGGLRDSERLTLRNEIVWDKGHGQGMESESHRMYPTATERCLFFMLGEQGFNNNASNYWDGWESVRSYLESEAVKVKLTNSDLKRICGVGSMYSHWFTKSQWIFIPEHHYRKLQAHYSGDAFKRDYDALKRDYDALKRDFYATRAHFDNTHESMTDVWRFPVVQGDDRHGHATPKPVDMVARAIKSSAPSSGIVLAPFSGTGPEIIACEQLGRKCRAVELHPPYIAVALQRWADMTGKTPVRIESAI